MRLLMLAPFTALVFYTFTAFGFCWGIGGSKLSLPVRTLIDNVTKYAFRPMRVLFTFLLDLVECPACLGFWVGLVVGHYVTVALGLPHALALALAFYTSGVNYCLGRLAGLIAEP